MNPHRVPPVFLKWLLPAVFPIVLTAFVIPLTVHAQTDECPGIQTLADITRSKKGQTQDQQKAICVIEKLVTSQERQITQLKKLLDAQQKEIADIRSAGQGSHESEQTQDRAAP